MATFTAVVSDPETGLSYQVDVDGQDGNRFVGREIGESVDGDAVGLPGYTVEITGGSDTAGRPLHADVGGSSLSEVLLAEGPGYRPTKDGERRRVTVRGREVGEETVQLNLRIDERGDQRVEVLLGDAEPEDFEEDAEETAESETDEAASEDDDEEAAAEEESVDEDEGEEESAETDEDDEAADAESEDEDDESDEAADADEDDETEEDAEDAAEADDEEDDAETEDDESEAADDSDEDDDDESEAADESEDEDADEDDEE